MGNSAAIGIARFEDKGQACTVRVRLLEQIFALQFRRDQLLTQFLVRHRQGAIRLRQFLQEPNPFTISYIISYRLLSSPLQKDYRTHRILLADLGQFIHFLLHRLEDRVSRLWPLTCSLGQLRLHFSFPFIQTRSLVVSPVLAQSPTPC